MMERAGEWKVESSEWRRAIAQFETQLASSVSSSSHHTRVTVTPFEKNIEVWRQLWRVIERSHCIVLVVDGRNPLFYINTDLRKYVEVELGKPMIVVVNKCDYLTQKQRQIWHEYFKSVSHGLEHVFFSVMREQEILDSFASNNDDIGTIANHDNNGVDDNDDIDQYSEYMAVPEYPTILNPSKIGITNPLARRELIDVLSKYAHIKGVRIPNDG